MPFCSRVTSRHATDRQTDNRAQFIMPLPYGVGGLTSHEHKSWSRSSRSLHYTVFSNRSCHMAARWRETAPRAVSFWKFLEQGNFEKIMPPTYVWLCYGIYLMEYAFTFIFGSREFSPTVHSLSVTALIDLTFDLLTSKYVYGLPVWWASFCQFWASYVFPFSS